MNLETPILPMKETTSQPNSEGRRTLSDNYTESENQIKRFRQPARMIVGAVDGTVTYLKTKSLEKYEKEEGETAFASLLYEEGAMLSARLLVLLWIITVLSARIGEYFEARKRDAEERKRSAPPTLAPQAPPPERRE